MSKGSFFQKGSSFPKGIINIINDYSHTLFYLDELKDKTKHICKYSQLNIDCEGTDYYDAVRCYDGQFYLGSSIHISRYNLMDIENKRRYLFNIKQEKHLYSPTYSKNYKPY